jgi:hypothetical protein
MQRNPHVRLAHLDDTAVVSQDHFELCQQIIAEQVRCGDRGAVNAGGVEVAVGER